MVSFENDISEICSLELPVLCGGYKYSVFSGQAVVVEGHSGIKSYSQNCMIFKIKKCALHVNGCDLSLKKLSRGFAVVVGKISSVEVKNC